MRFTETRNTARQLGDVGKNLSKTVAAYATFKKPEHGIASCLAGVGIVLFSLPFSIMEDIRNG